MSEEASYWFEKGMAVVFLLILVGMVIFFNYVPLVQESKNVILLILGVLVSTAKDAVPRIFGVYENQAKKLEERLLLAEQQIKELTLKNQTLKAEYDNILEMLVNDYLQHNQMEKLNESRQSN